MKPRFIFLVFLIFCFACGTKNKPLSDAQKEKIKGEIKEVVNTMFKGCEVANFEIAIESFLDSPDFVYVLNGVLLYKTSSEIFIGMFVKENDIIDCNGGLAVSGS
jgi:hypothetical protein